MYRIATEFSAAEASARGASGRACETHGEAHTCEACEAGFFLREGLCSEVTVCNAPVF